MKKKLFDLLGGKISRDFIIEHTEAIHRLEGNISYSNFKSSTDYCMEMMKEAGFEGIQRIVLPADGKTVYFDCVMPQAWETTGRSFLRLEDVAMSMKERMIADSDKDPFTTGIWSAPTPQGGLDCEIVDFRLLDPASPSIRGKLVLMDGFSAKQYRFISDLGAAGVIISDSKAGEEYPDHCRWSNGIGFTGWYHTRDDRRIPIFSITPRRADFLRQRLAKGKLMAHAEANTRIYDGEIYTLTGVISGKSKEEITLLAHMYEPFLPDDAAGGVVISEICRCLRELIAEGKLPELQKTLRIVLSMERYGFHEYFQNRERNKRTLAVFSFDSVCHLSGGNDKPQTKLRLSSMLMPSFMDLILPELFRKELPALRLITEKGNLSDDTFCSDDWIGIPSLWPHSGDMLYHHNAGSMFMNADWNLAFDITRIMGTLIGTLALGNETDYRRLALETLKLAKASFREQVVIVNASLKTGKLTARDAAAKLHFLGGQAIERVISINRFRKGTVKPGDIDVLLAMLDNARSAIKVSGEAELRGSAKEAAKLVVRRLVPGTLMSLARIPHKERRSSSVIPDLLYILLDGKRSLYDAMKLYEYEMDQTFADEDFARYVEFLRYLEKYGYVAISVK